MTGTSYDHLTLLGHYTTQPSSPDAAKRERVANPPPDGAYVIR